MIPFNYHHLYYFYVIAKEGSISKATKHLRLAQPTLSTQLKQFETFLNVQLFIREKRNLILTEEGHQVFAYAKTIFDIGRELKDRMVDLTHQKGRKIIQIGIPNSIPKTITETVLSYILKIEPNAYIVLVKDKLSKLNQDLEDHIIDLILSDTPSLSHKSAGLSNHSIGKVPVVFCAHPKIARTIRKMPADLNGIKMLLPGSSRPIFQKVHKYFLENHIEPEIVGEFDDVEIIRRLALRGHGVAALNLLTVLKAPAKEKLVVLKTNEKDLLFEDFYLIIKKRKMTHPLVERLIDDFKIERFI